MASTEVLLTIGALILLSMFTLTLNSHMVQDRAAMFQSEQYLEAIGSAQRFIEQAEVLRFDEHKDASAIASFTSSANLGPDTGESYGSFDDIDDYDGYSVQDSLTNSILFTINVSVYYVDPNYAYTPTTSNTYYKEMTVSIHSDAFSGPVEGTIVLRKLFAYHYFFSD